MKIPSQCDHDYRYYRFERRMDTFQPIEDWSPSNSAADRVVFIVAALCAVGLIFI